MTRRHRDPEPDAADRALAAAQEARAAADRRDTRAAPVLARLERHLSRDHIYEAVMATIVSKP